MVGLHNAGTRMRFATKSWSILGRKGLNFHSLLHPLRAQTRAFFASVPCRSATHYIDEWFAETIKPKSFYQKHSKATSSNNRCYFYSVDLQGRLFLEETLPKNIATSIKDTKFLDFFFRRVRRISPEQATFLHERNISWKEYPFVSVCGVEKNFIRPAATPIVFHSLISDDSELSFAGNLVEPFNVENLAISPKSGRLYHRLTKPVPKSKTSQVLCLEYALIRSAVAVQLSEIMEPLEEEEHISDSDSKSYSGLQIQLGKGGYQRIPWLPVEYEPGDWAMPFQADVSQ
jgi:hypothetical protein